MVQTALRMERDCLVEVVTARGLRHQEGSANSCEVSARCFRLVSVASLITVGLKTPLQELVRHQETRGAAMTAAWRSAMVLPRRITQEIGRKPSMEHNAASHYPSIDAATRCRLRRHSACACCFHQNESVHPSQLPASTRQHVHREDSSASCLPPACRSTAVVEAVLSELRAMLAAARGSDADAISLSETHPTTPTTRTTRKDRSSLGRRGFFLFRFGASGPSLSLARCAGSDP
jgi:hypothetical protein